MDFGPGGLSNPGPSGYGGGYNATTAYSGPSGGDGGGGGGNTDPYGGYVAASKPRGGLQGIKDYFTGGGYDYGYQRSFGKDLRGIGGLLLGLVNPALGLAYRGYQRFKPELNLLKNSPTIESFLNNRRNLMEEVPLNKINIFNPEGITKTRSAIDFIDPTKTISGDYLDIRDRIEQNTGYGRNQIDLVKNYGRADLEKLGAKDRTILGPNDQLEELQNYYNAVQQLSGPGSKFAPNDPARARDFITNQSKQLGGSYNIDMDLIPQDFLQTQEDLQQQKSPYSLFDI